MPFLRVVRDKRGYETTYLMDWYRDGVRQRSRVLYAFRTPGGVRVGRVALDPEIQTQIQAQYPGIAFDWKAVLDSRQVIDAAPEARRQPVRRRGVDDAPAVEAAPASDALERPRLGQQPARPPIPAAIEGDTPEARVAFLAEWYPVVRERVSQRMSDPLRRDALLALTERLDPSGWVDAEQVTAGVQQASEALEQLSRVLTRRRRRSGRGRTGQAETATGGAADAAPDAEAGESSEGPSTANDAPPTGE